VLRNPTLAPRRRITSYAHRLRATLLAHPGVAPLLLSAPMDGPAALLVGELLLATLADAGLAPDDAARATYLLIVLLVGAVALEVAETDGRAPLPPEDARIAGRRAAMSAVPPDALPRTSAAVDVIAAWIGTDQLDWMLERTLDGILSRGRPAPR
jgi:TetR/AcrR family transcriptional regulator, tetracycline repressor protein